MGRGANKIRREEELDKEIEEVSIGFECMWGVKLGGWKEDKEWEAMRGNEIQKEIEYNLPMMPEEVGAGVCVGGGSRSPE